MFFGPQKGNYSPYLCFFSLPEVKWLFTKPKEVPLNMNDTPTAPLLPGGEQNKKQRYQEINPPPSWDNKEQNTS